MSLIDNMVDNMNFCSWINETLQILLHSSYSIHTSSGKLHYGTQYSWLGELGNSDNSFFLLKWKLNRNNKLHHRGKTSIYSSSVPLRKVIAWSPFFRPSECSHQLQRETETHWLISEEIGSKINGRSYKHGGFWRTFLESSL